MKNSKYYVLKTVYKLSKENKNNFVSQEKLLENNCPENVITHLEFQKFLTYKRENKTDFYNITLEGIEYIYQKQHENINLIASIIAAVASIISILIPILSR